MKWIRYEMDKIRINDEEMDRIGCRLEYAQAHTPARSVLSLAKAHARG
jgi:hypothetical protein